MKILISSSSTLQLGNFSPFGSFKQNKTKKKQKGRKKKHASYKGKHSPAFFSQRSGLQPLLLGGRGMTAMTSNGCLQSALRQVLLCPRGTISLVLNFTLTHRCGSSLSRSPLPCHCIPRMGVSRPSLVPVTEASPHTLDQLPAHPSGNS